MRIFGCVAMTHILPKDRKKMDPKSKRMIFVGYPLTQKGYRVIDPTKNFETTVSREIDFLENTKYYKDKDKDKVISNSV